MLLKIQNIDVNVKDSVCVNWYLIFVKYKQQQNNFWYVYYCWTEWIIYASKYGYKEIVEMFLKISNIGMFILKTNVFNWHLIKYW